MGVFSDIINKIRETHISKDERLDNFNEWYRTHGKGGQRRGQGIPRHRRKRDYLALKSVWEESGSPLISTEAYNEEYGKKFPGRPHAIRKPFYYGKTGLGSDKIYSIRNYDDLFAELAHTFRYKDQGIISRYIDQKRSRFERDDPSEERINEGDQGMYDKKTIDFSDRVNKLGLKDIWSLETQAHGYGEQYTDEGGVGRQEILKKQYEDMFLKSVASLSG